MSYFTFGNGNLKLNEFLVCGLGLFGQHCVMALKEFGVKVIAIEKVHPENWELPEVIDLLDDLIFGDCRLKDTLEKANIKHCRAALLVTSNEQVNIETALAIRRLNPHTRLVVRSATDNLNQLFSDQLGNFIAYEPTELSTNAFALGAIGTDILGFFKLDEYWLQVVDHPIEQQLLKGTQNQVAHWNTNYRQVLFHVTSKTPISSNFYQWHSEAKLEQGDRLIYIEASDHLGFNSQLNSVLNSCRQRQKKTPWLDQFNRGIKEKIRSFLKLSFQQQIQRVALISSLVVLILLMI